MESEFEKFGKAEKDIIGWDAPIKDDGENHNFTVLPEGVYDFTVVSFERKYYSGTESKAPCNFAQLELEIHGGELGEGHCYTALFLKDTVMWKIATFFVSLGLLKPKDELKTMPWDKIIGKSGKAEFSIRKYTGKNFEEKEANDVKYFLAPTKTEKKKKAF